MLNVNLNVNGKFYSSVNWQRNYTNWNVGVDYNWRFNQRVISDFCPAFEPLFTVHSPTVSQKWQGSNCVAGVGSGSIASDNLCLLRISKPDL